MIQSNLVTDNVTTVRSVTLLWLIKAYRVTQQETRSALICPLHNLFTCQPADDAVLSRRMMWSWLQCACNTAVLTDRNNTVCPTRYRTRHFFNNSNTSEDLDILLTVHLSIIYFSLFPTWYTVFPSTYNICYPLSSTCLRPHRPFIRRSKLYMQPMVFSSSADVFVVRP